jgi:MoxR-like ATPase
VSNATELDASNARVHNEHGVVDAVLASLGHAVVGQRLMLERLLIGLVSDGHVLLEGVPGLAKTLAIKTLAQAVSCRVQRVQFTPDLLPSDLVGTMVYNQRVGDFTVQKGPIFANIVIADEINRAPAKVQSALLEAMQEKQVTIGGATYALEEPFLVLATQNPLEQEGTYPLPEAQVDRFMMKLLITYPSRAEESEMLDRASVRGAPPISAIVDTSWVLRAREVVDAIYVDARVRDYVLDIVRATREPIALGLKDLVPLIDYGASPRASIALVRAAKGHAFLEGRGHVTPADIKSMGPDVLRHRLILTYEADAESVTADQVLARIFDVAPVP